MKNKSPALCNDSAGLIGYVIMLLQTTLFNSWYLLGNTVDISAT